MKIIKEGNWKNPWSREIVCSEKCCGATLLVEEVDLIAPACESNNIVSRYEFMCPVCAKKNDVPPKELPLRVREILDKKRVINRAWTSDR